MKDRIATRLFSYFTIVLLLFSLFLGSLFLFLFSKHTSEIYRSDLEKRATTIAATLSSFLQSQDENGGRGHGVGGGYGAYIRFLDEIAMSDLWIIDKDMQTIRIGNRKEEVIYSELPPDIDSLVKDIFTGQIVYGNNFTPFLEVPSITVGAPILGNNGTVYAALLLHTEAEGVALAVWSGLKILLLSLLVALLLAIFVSLVLSKHFTKPLERMELTTRKLVNGDYKAQTAVVQGDEIGSLASHIDNLANQLEKASNQRNELEQMRKNFISNISHELRTPVTVMRGSLDALCDGIITKEHQVKEYYEQMRLESIHLEHMINDLLDLSRLQNPEYVIEKSLIQLQDVIEDALRSMKQLAYEKNITIEYENHLAESSYYGDYVRLRQMFMIVLNNAVKFSERNQSIVLKAIKEEEQYKITVIDRGKGILEKDINHIFERFYKDPDERNQKGTGLGLAIAKEIADRHEIVIEVNSVRNKNTSFTFIFKN